MTTENYGRVHTYPYCESDPCGPKRNCEQHYQSAIEAVHLNCTVKITKHIMIVYITHGCIYVYV